MKSNYSLLKEYWIYLPGIIMLALPLLNLPPWFSPPDWGKTIIFRSIIALLLFAFIFKLFLSKTSTLALQNLRSIKPILASLLIFIGIFFLATIFSLDRTFSQWGDPSRSGGVINFFTYVIFSLLLFLVLEKKHWQIVWIFSICIGILVSLTALLQWRGVFSEFFI